MVAMSRFFVAGVSVLALFGGTAAVIVGESTLPIVAGVLLIVAGLAGLLRAIAKGGRAPVESASDVVDLLDGD